MIEALPKIPQRDLPKPGPRKALTRVQILQIAIRQKLLCGCGCGVPLEPECIDEHVIPRETLPADRCDHIDNRALFNKACAKAKTVGDQAVIAKGRRLRLEKGQQKRRAESGSRLKSPGFQQRPEGVPSALSKHSKGYVKRGFGK